MAQVELIMPKMGESIMEATILKWLKKPGDKIEQDESVLEVATDKVDTEVPSTHAGVLKEILAKEGEVVKVGKAIAIITSDVVAGVETENVVVERKIIETQKEVSTSTNGTASHAAAVVAPTDFKNASRFYSPLVKNIAKEEQVALAELESISGTGAEGRVTKKDMLEFIQQRKLGQTIASTPRTTSAPLVPASISSGDEIIQMDRMRKMIAERMVDSKRISPHVTSFVEADVTNIVFWRNKWKNDFQKREGDALTFTPIFIEAVMMAIKDYPMINIQVDGDRIIKKKDINIGMAVALPSGNLIVPVIKNADQYNISNVMGTPIIMQPQVAILALGAVQKKPAVMETPYGDAIVVRHKMFLSHSYDHRVVDGSLGGSFVRRVADYLEKFDANRRI